MKHTITTPTPEFMEAYGRAQEKYGRLNIESLRKEATSIASGDSVCAGLTDEAAKHRAVAKRYPDLYYTESDRKARKRIYHDRKGIECFLREHGIVNAPDWHHLKRAVKDGLAAELATRYGLDDEVAHVAWVISDYFGLREAAKRRDHEFRKTAET